MKQKIAIITGASSGLGVEYFNAVADEGKVQEIWLIARRADKLNEIAATRPNIKTKVVPLDLLKEEELNKLSELLAAEKPDILLLINNAGYGLLGPFNDLPEKGQADMVRLNCVALTSICAFALKYMKSGSQIINISSIASFAATPRMSVYCATKFFITTFTRSLRYELRGTGINALAVCPGPMNTEFLDKAGISGKSKTFDNLPRNNPKTVARNSLKKAAAGRGMYTEGAFFKFYRLIAKVLPMDLVMNFSKT